MVDTFPAWPVYDKDEQEAVLQVLQTGRGNYWSGEFGKQFEDSFATWCGAKHGLCVSNGTVAIEIALKSLGISAGDEVIVPARSFLASAASVVAVNAKPVFADIEIGTGNICPKSIHANISSNTKAIIVVHLDGCPAKMDEIMDIARSNGLLVIEDCAQAHGASIRSQMVGTFGDIGTFSFCQDKIMSTGGEGGMIVTNSNDYYEVSWSFRDHGRDRALTLSGDHPPGFRWLQTRFGTNARMTEIQSAIGCCQLKKVDEWVKQRQSNAAQLCEIVASWDGAQVPEHLVQHQSVFYRLGVLCESEQIRNYYMQSLKRLGIPATVGACPEIYEEAAFKIAGLCPRERLSNAVEQGKRYLAIPVHPGVETAISRFLEVNSPVHP